MINYKKEYSDIFNSTSLGWNDTNNPGEVEKGSGLWITKTGARYFPNGFSYFTTPDNLHWEWGAILEGGIEFEYLGKTYQIYEGDCYIMPPEYELTAKPIGNLFVLWIEFNGPLSELAMTKCGCNRYDLTFAKYSEPQVKTTFKIASLLHNHPSGYEILINSLFWEFLAYSISPEINCAMKISPEIRKIINKLSDENYYNNYSLLELSQLTNLTLETFRKKFTSEVGESPISFMLRGKINYSKQLLSNTEMTIKQIAHKVGFSDPYYFSRIFKKFEALSPQQYKKRFHL